MKIIGILLTWNNLIFLKYSLKQALQFCDEVIVVEGGHSKHHEIKSTDGTREHLKSIKDPKLKLYFADELNYTGRYDNVQCSIRQFALRESTYHKPGNWIIPWDDDMFYFDKDLVTLRKVMSTTKHDTLTLNQKAFGYNFRFCASESKAVRFNRITKGCFYQPISHLCYKDSRRYGKGKSLDLTCFHYSRVKKSNRMKARWLMSIEKGTKVSIGGFERWMAFRWKDDQDFLRQEKEVLYLFSNPNISVYNGVHPEIVKDHPWLTVNDTRTLK